MRSVREFVTTMAWLLLLPGVASAQFGDPEAGDTGNWTPPAQPQQPSSPPPAQPQQPSWFQQDQERPPALGQQRASTDSGAADAAETDHARVVGAIGFQYIGRRRASFVTPTGDDAPQAVEAAGVGIRYWLSDSLGLDLGAFVGYAGPSSELNGEFQSGFSGFGIGLHAGLPIALQAYEHLTFLVIPEAAFLFGSLGFQGVDASQDWSSSHLAIDLGARVGAEVQLGFWGIPQLSVQMTVGGRLRYESWSAEMLDDREVNASSAQTSFVTDADDLFEGTVRVVYYLP